MNVQTASPFTNGHANSHVSQLQFLAACTTCPETMNFTLITEELKKTSVDQTTASLVLKKFIQWEVFTKAPLFTLETVSLVTYDRAVSIPVLTLLLRSEELREYAKTHKGDIPCYGTSHETLSQLYTTLTTTTNPVTLPTIDKQ
jgi:hypothetical protein